MSIEKKGEYYNVGEDFAKYLDLSFQMEVDELFRHLVAKNLPRERVLDVGCASGRTSAFTRKLGTKELVGIEMDPRGCEIAAEHMDRVIQGDVATVELDYEPGYFDVVFLTDILEHLVDPWAALARFVNLLRPGGHAIVVLPNFGHISVITEMLTGDLRYQDDGILDNGHLRWFVKATAVELLKGAGLSVVRLIERVDEGVWEQAQKAQNIALGEAITLVLNPEKVPLSLKRQYFVRKYNFLARKAAGRRPHP